MITFRIIRVDFHKGETQLIHPVKTRTRHIDFNWFSGINLLLRNGIHIIGNRRQNRCRKIIRHSERRTNTILSIPLIGVCLIQRAVGQNNFVLHARRYAVGGYFQVGAESSVCGRRRNVKARPLVCGLLVRTDIGRGTLGGNNEATQLMVCQEFGSEAGAFNMHRAASLNF